MKLLLVLIFFPISLLSQIVISEIQPAPDSPEPEWVEIYNLGDTTFICTDCQIGDELTVKDLPEFTLLPQAYLIITDDSLSLAEAYTLPQGSQVIEIALPALNNSGDAVRLLIEGSLIDSTAYPGSIEKGHSLEKRILQEPWTSENWSQPTEISGTPGLPNSNAPKEYNLVIDSLNQIGDNWMASFTNKGTEPVTLSSIIMDEKIFPLEEPLQPKENKQFSFDLPESDIYGFNSYTLSYSFLAGEQLISQLYDTISIFHPPNIYPYITEVMYDPADSLCEFVEFLYQGDKPLNLNGFRIADKATKDRAKDSELDITLNPGDRIAVGADSSIYDYPNKGDLLVSVNLPALNNGGDDIYIYPPEYGVSLDSTPFTYTADDHTLGLEDHQGISLELREYLDEKSLLSCIDEHASTPGLPNSNDPKDYEITIDTIYQSSENITLSLSNKGLKATDLLSLLIGDQTLEIDEKIDPGTNEEFYLPIPEEDYYGLISYQPILQYEAGDIASINADSLTIFLPPDKMPLITEIMFDPVDTLCQFIEIFWDGDKPFNLDGCALYLEKSGLPEHGNLTEYKIIPGEYLAIASDSTIFNYPLVGPAITVNDFPRLDRNGETIILSPPVDFPSLENESLAYSEDIQDDRYNSTRGISIERVESQLGYHLRSSADPNGSTPGRANSWYGSEDISEKVLIEPNPFDRTRPTTISYDLFSGSGFITISIYSESGSMINTLYSKPAPGRGNIQWDASDQNGSPIPPGIYLLHLQATEDKSGEEYIVRKAVVVGE